MATRVQPAEDHVAIVTGPLDLTSLAEQVRTDASGAVALFAGVVRNHHRGRSVESLEYEAYAPMAEREIRRIAASARTRWALHGVAVLHRTGRLRVGETSIAVAVSSAHRRDALEACAWILDRVKESAPVWKKEHGEAGEGWILGDQAPPRPPAEPRPRPAARSSRRRAGL